MRTLSAILYDGRVICALLAMAQGIVLASQAEHVRDYWLLDCNSLRKWRQNLLWGEPQACPKSVGGLRSKPVQASTVKSPKLNEY